MPGPLLGRDLWFDSCKRPPAVSDPKFLPFGLSLTGDSTVVSNLYICPCSRLGPKFAYSLYGVFLGLLRQNAPYVRVTYSSPHQESQGEIFGGKWYRPHAMLTGKYREPCMPKGFDNNPKIKRKPMLPGNVAQLPISETISRGMGTSCQRNDFWDR